MCKYCLVLKKSLAFHLIKSCWYSYVGEGCDIFPCIAGLAKTLLHTQCMPGKKSFGSIVSFAKKEVQAIPEKYFVTSVCSAHSQGVATPV